MSSRNVNCAECEQPASVLHGDVPLCGPCFYKGSILRRDREDTDGPRQNDAMWQRLSEAIAALEIIASRIAAQMNELVKSRNDHQ